MNKKVLRKGTSLLLALVMVLTLLPATALPAVAASAQDQEGGALEALGIDSGKAPEGYDPNAKNPYGKDTVTLNPVKELYTVGLSSNTTSGEAVRNKGPLSEFKDPDNTVIYNYFEDRTQTLSGRLYGNEVWGKSTAAQVLSSGDSVVTGIATGISRHSATYRASLIESHESVYRENVDVSTTLYNAAGSFNIALSSVVEGNFDGNTEGKTAQAVMVFTSEFSKNGGLYFSVGDILDGEYGSPKTLISNTADIGNPEARLDESDVTKIENFSTSPYLLQNYLQIATGDFDGCGRDEIAVYIPEFGKSRIEVYKLRITSSSGPKSHLEPDMWAREWTYSLQEFTYASNMVSMTTGDFNKDGICDLAATWGYYYGPDIKSGSRAVVMFGAETMMLSKAQEFALEVELEYGTKGQIIRGAFTYGDFLGIGSDVLVLGGQLDADLSKGNLNTRFVSMYTWDGVKFVQNETLSQNFDLFARDEDNNWVHPAMVRNQRRSWDYVVEPGKPSWLGGWVERIFPYEFYSAPLCVSNLAVVGQGLGKNARLYFDSLMIEYSDEYGLFIAGTYDNTNRMQVNTNTDSLVPYVEYGVVSGDVVGLGEDTVATMTQTFPTTSESTASGLVSGEITVREAYYENWWYKLWGIKSYRYVVRTVTESIEEVMLAYSPGITTMVTLYDNSAHLRTVVDRSTAICMPNTDDDTTYLNYNAKHYFMYTDPQVLAVLASPPYFGDLLDRDDLSGNYAESSTSYRSSQGSGSGLTVSATISAGFYVKVEQEFSVFGVKVAQAEAEVAVTAEFTYDYEKMTMLEQSVEYMTTPGEDRIAFYSIPIEVFEFTAYIPDGEGGYDTQLMTINIPRIASVSTITLDDYERIALDYVGILPQISGNVLTHTLGDPSSYPSSSRGFSNAIEYSGTPARVGYTSAGGGSAITQEIAMSKEVTNSYSFSIGIESKVGAGAGGVTLGVIIGAQGGAGWVNVTTEGSSFAGMLQDMPIEAEPFGYYHTWRIFSYEYNNGKLRFPVVSYIVEESSAPPPLPEDFAQDNEGTTSNQVTLTWSYEADRTIGGFQLYRYYEFPDGSGSYDLAFVPFVDGVLDKDSGMMEFSYTDEGLNPYSVYNYQIQSVRAAVPQKSIYSEPLAARTKTDRGYPVITLNGLNPETGLLYIFPDTTSSVQVVVTENQGPYNAQWQVYRNGKWNDIGGATTDRLTFINAGAADEALFRCRINTIYFDTVGGNEYYISAYSKTFSTAYNKRTAVATNDGIGAVAAGNQLGLSLTLISADYNHNEAPTGTVTFTIKGTDYEKSVTCELVTGLTLPGGKIPATATGLVDKLPSGVYEITAFYTGSRVFKTYEHPETKVVLVGGGEGWLLNLRGEDGANATGFVYGDTISPSLLHVTDLGMSIENGAELALFRYELITFPNYKAAFWSPVFVETIDDKFQTPDAGKYLIEATVGGEVVAERDFTVTARPITVFQEDTIVYAGSVTGNEPENFFRLSGQTPMAFNDSLADLDLDYLAINTAGNRVIIDNDTLPGNYMIHPVSYHKNYDTTFIPGLYTILGVPYNVTYSALPHFDTIAGTITLLNVSPSGDGKFTAATELMFSASAYRDYEIDQWTVSAGGNVVTQQNGGGYFTYMMLSEDIEVTVSFKSFAPELLVDVLGGRGSISCNVPTFEVGKQQKVSVGSELVLTAVPGAGYHFVKWNLYVGTTQSENFGVGQSDGSNVLNFKMPERSARVYAEFERDSYTLTLADNLEVHYTYVDPLGNVIPRVAEGSATIQGDTVVTIRPTAGYMIASDGNWVATVPNGVAEDDVPEPPEAGEQAFVFEIKSDIHVSADVVLLTFSVSADCDSDTGQVSFTINGVPSGGNEVSGIDGGSRIVFTAIPEREYVFGYWDITINGVTDQVYDRVFAIERLRGNVEAVAYFESNNEYTVSIQIANYPERGSAKYTLTGILGDTVFSDKAYDGEFVVYKGEALAIAIETKSSFMVSRWSVNGDIYSDWGSTFTIADISQDLDISVLLVPITYKTVFYEAGENGAIVSATYDGFSFSSGYEYVAGGSKVVITAAPDKDYMVDTWIVNGEVALDATGNPFVGEELVIKCIAGGPQYDIEVYFTEIVYYYFNVEGDDDAAWWTVSCEPPLDSDRILHGATAEFTFTPYEGCKITDITVNGLSVTAEVNDGVWTIVISPVNEDLEIEFFAEELSGDATLKALSVNGFTLAPDFDPDVLTYSVTVPYATNLVTVTATPNHEGAKVFITPPATPLIVGSSPIFIGVTAENGTTLEYRINVTRQPQAQTPINPANPGNTGGGPTGPVTIIVPEPPPLVGLESFAAFINGYPDNTFRGQSFMSREEFVNILYKIKNPQTLPKADPATPTFSDVAPGRWSYDAIEWAAAAEIAEAGNGAFRPAVPITRAEIAVMLAKAVGLGEMAENTFSDLGDYPARDDILKAVFAGIFTGYPDGTFRPDGNATRYEVVTALVRYLLGGEPTDEMWATIELPFTDVLRSHWAYKYVALAAKGYVKLPD